MAIYVRRLFRHVKTAVFFQKPKMPVFKREEVQVTFRHPGTKRLFKF